MTEKEKTDLRQKILSSSRPYKNKVRRMYYNVCVAASVLLVVSLGLYKYNDRQTHIADFVEKVPLIEMVPTDEVQLLFNGNKSLVIEKENALIKYASSGNSLNTIDSLGRVREIALDKATAFHTLMVPYGQRSQVELSDGTRVWLNSGSSLIYPPSFAKGDREVYLKGEAIFDVAHKARQPFRVISGDHRVEVLGTVFNVSSYPEDPTITTVLKSGSVRISHQTDSFLKAEKTTKISPGTMALYDKKRPGLQTREVDIEDYFSWRDGKLIFKSNNLKYITKKLGRYYNVSINFEGLDVQNETFSGQLSLKDSIQGVLDILQETSNFDYYYNENGTILIKKQDDM